MNIVDVLALPEQGRILGVDLGEVRVGLAVTDESQTIAAPAVTLSLPEGTTDEQLADRLAVEVRERQAVGVVVGYPRTLAGREGAAARRARRLAERLSGVGRIPVALVDERLTTVEAERVMLEQDARRTERRQSIDRVAASLILQSALDRRRTR